MRGRTVVVAALAILLAIAALVYGVLDSPPVPNQTNNPNRVTRTDATDRGNLPPNARNELPGEARPGAPLRDPTGTVGAAPGSPGTAQPHAGTPPGGAGR
jgi:hypothetical protein